MTDVTEAKVNKVNCFLFRAFCLYLLLYFTFISDFASSYPVVWRLDELLKRISNALGLALNKAFFNPEFKEWRFFDSYWTYSKLIFFLVLSLIAAAVWTMADKGKRSQKLFVYMYAFSRYYLAIAILSYCLSKFFETQFYLELKNFLLPIYYSGPRAMFWTFMASARSYSYFGGLIEALAVGFLFFRKTSTLGALILMGVLINILIMDVAYDTPIKVIVLHLMLFNTIILWPDAQGLFRFFVLKQTETLATVPPAISNEKFKKTTYIAKVLLIALAIVPKVISGSKSYDNLNHPYYEKLVGIHEIDSSYKLSASGSMLLRNPDRWTKFTIEQGNTSHVLLAGDSIAEYRLAADIHSATVAIMSPDSTFSRKFHYANIDSAHWLFESISGTDSIRFVTKQIDIHRFPLLKDNGRIIWSWMSPP